MFVGFRDLIFASDLSCFHIYPRFKLALRVKEQRSLNYLTITTPFI